MESQGHYMEAFSCLLVFHLSIDLLAICLLLTYIYSLFYPISILYNYYGLFYFCVFLNNIDTYT